MNQDMLQKKVLLNAFKIVVTLTALYVASYAWFFRGQDFQAGDININTESINNIEISLDGGETWSSRASFDLGDDLKFNSEITGDGVNLYAPVSRQSDGTPTEFREATPDKDYLEMEIMFRSLVDTAIFLNTTASVLPSAGDEEVQLIGPEVARKSSFGNFTRDLIAASTRVSMIDSEYIGEEFVFNEQPSIVWAPNKNYHIYQENGSYNVDLNSTAEQNYNYLNVVNNLPAGEARPHNLKDNINVNFGENMAYGDPLITRINSVVDGYYMSKIRVKVWIEGNDRDTVTPLKGGLFKISLSFAGLEKPDNPSIPDVSENLIDNSINNYGEGMEVSIDFGNTWVSYDNNPSPTFSSGNTVYVRYFETENHLASEYVELQF